MPDCQLITYILRFVLQYFCLDFLAQIKQKKHCPDSVPGWHGGLMVSVLYCGASGPGLSPGRGHCVVFLGKTLYSHSASLHPGV